MLYDKLDEKEDEAVLRLSDAFRIDEMPEDFEIRAKKRPVKVFFY